MKIVNMYILIFVLAHYKYEVLTFVGRYNHMYPNSYSMEARASSGYRVSGILLLLLPITYDCP